tara:strand:+ start:769 stop:1365 length:597 start_codon:yes stop_codon:yes gene_type:complete
MYKLNRIIPIFLLIISFAFLDSCSGGGGSSSPTSSEDSGGGDTGGGSGGSGEGGGSGGDNTAPNIVITFSFYPVADCQSCNPSSQASQTTQVVVSGQSCGSCYSCSRLAFNYTISNTGDATANLVRIRFKAQYGVFTNITVGGTRTTYSDQIIENYLAAGSSRSGTVVIQDYDYYDQANGLLTTWTQPLITLTELYVN